MEIENEKVRINGVAPDLLFVKKMNFSMDYVIEISIKDDKYKFELISLTTGGTDYKKIAELLKKSPKSIDNALQRIKKKTEKMLKTEIRA